MATIKKAQQGTTMSSDSTFVKSLKTSKWKSVKPKKKVTPQFGVPADTTKVARPNRVYASGGKITPCAGCGKSIKKKKK